MEGHTESSSLLSSSPPHISSEANLHIPEDDVLQHGEHHDGDDHSSSSSPTITPLSSSPPLISSAANLHISQEGDHHHDGASWASSTPIQPKSNNNDVDNTTNNINSTKTTTTTYQIPTNNYPTMTEPIEVPLYDEDFEQLPDEESKDAILNLKKVLDKHVSL